MSEYFPKSNFSGANVKVESDLLNYTTKTDLKNATGVDTLDFAKKIDLTNLKYDVDNLDIDKLKNVPNTSSNLKSKVDTSDVDQRSKVKNIEGNIPDIVNLVTNTTLNDKINEIKNKIPSIFNLATTAALTTVENKIPNVSDRVKKVNYDAKISQIKNKYLTTFHYNKFTSNTPDVKITQKKLVNEYSFFYLGFLPTTSQTFRH